MRLTLDERTSRIGRQGYPEPVLEVLNCIALPTQSKSLANAFAVPMLKAICLC